MNLFDAEDYLPRRWWRRVLILVRIGILLSPTTMGGFVVYEAYQAGLGRASLFESVVQSFIRRQHLFPTAAATHALDHEIHAAARR